MIDVLQSMGSWTWPVWLVFGFFGMLIGKKLLRNRQRKNWSDSGTNVDSAIWILKPSKAYYWAMFMFGVFSLLGCTLPFLVGKPHTFEDFKLYGAAIILFILPFLVAFLGKWIAVDGTQLRVVSFYGRETFFDLNKLSSAESRKAKTFSIFALGGLYFKFGEAVLYVNEGAHHTKPLLSLMRPYCEDVQTVIDAQLHDLRD